MNSHGGSWGAAGLHVARPVGQPREVGSKPLTASGRRVLMTQWMGAAMELLNNRQEYRFRLLKKCGMAMTVGGSGDEKNTSEGSEKP